MGEGNPVVAGELIAEGLVDHNRPQGQPADQLAGEDWMAKMTRTAFPRRHLPGGGHAA